MIGHFCNFCIETFLRCSISESNEPDEFPRGAEQLVRQRSEHAELEPDDAAVHAVGAYAAMPGRSVGDVHGDERRAADGAAADGRDDDVPAAELFVASAGDGDVSEADVDGSLQTEGGKRYIDVRCNTVFLQRRKNGTKIFGWLEVYILDVSYVIFVLRRVLQW